MTGFRIGSFNVIPSYTVMMLSIAGIGALPFYVRYGLTGEKPRPKDSFERYREQQQMWENVRGRGACAATGVRRDGPRG